MKALCVFLANWSYNLWHTRTLLGKVIFIPFWIPVLFLATLILCFEGPLDLLRWLIKVTEKK